MKELVNLLGVLDFLRRRKLKVADLSSWRVHGGPVEYREDISHPFLGQRSTKQRTIIWKFSGGSDAVVWRVDGKADFEVFTDREEASRFYHQKMGDLRVDCDVEAAEIRSELDREFAESWRNARRVYFYRGFKIRALIDENPFKINRRLLGVLKGPCPGCGEEVYVDGRDAFSNFLEELDEAIDSEGWMQSHSGHFSSYGALSTRIPCPNCRTYPSVTLEGQANRSLLGQMIRRLQK